MHKRLLLLGEPMGLFIAKNEGSLDNVSEYSLSIAGAEFNVAIGVSRLGHNVSYLTKLGDDPFGHKIAKFLKSNFIDNSHIIFSKDKNTGFMLKNKVTDGDPEIFYFRKNSAASTMSISDVENIDLSKFSHIHFTGIFPALTTNTKETVEYLFEKAKKQKLFISFDPNLRPQLWPNVDCMRNYLNKLASNANLVLPGVSEGEILCNSSDPHKINEFYLNNGAQMVITKCGAKGALCTDGNKETLIPGYVIDHVVDTVGAGDGFACGVITGLMEGLSVEESTQRACAIGAMQCLSVSDNEGLPNKEQLKSFMSSAKRVN